MCNGKETEPSYFEMLKRELGLGQLVEVDRSQAGKDPLTAAIHGVKALKADEREARAGKYDPYAAVWVVVDCDEFTNIGAASSTAKGSVSLVISNPCFEVWLIDHERECPASCATTRECERYARELGVTGPVSPNRTSLDKHKRVNEGSVCGKLNDAVRNARRHNTDEKRRVREGNPSNTSGYQVWTDMVDVAEVLIEEAAGVGGA